MRPFTLIGHLAYREPLTYNFQVTRELVKQVYVAERLQPPSWTTFTEVYKTLWQRAINPAYWRELLRTGEYKRVGIYALEAYGIFKVRSCDPFFLPFGFRELMFH